ncbi:IgGFc-binding protein [Dokdonia sp. Asnod2-E02]|uniref:IgGFc-binding protein n=1 Tax=Dokdonia sp. Asnod2-E02 TaxID=3160574 RepID=UPI00386BE059
MKIQNYALLIVLTLCTLPVFAQLGSTHYIPPVHARDVGGQDITSAYLYFSTPYDNPATATTDPIVITISLGNGTVLGTQTISAGAPASFNIGANILITNTELNQALSTKGIVVSSTELFYTSLRVQSSSGNHSGYLTGKGADALGSRFRVGLSQLNSNAGNHSFFTSIMAQEDNTVVTISEYDNDLVFEPNITTDSPLVINLNAGESYTITGYSSLVNTANAEGFIGALIQSDDAHPIVVNVGNLNSNEPTSNIANGSDIMMDQIVPENLVGSEYMLVRGNGNDLLERVLVVITQDNTDLYINGSATPNFTLGTAGDYIFIDQANLFLPDDGSAHRNMFIEASESKGIYVYQFIGGRAGANDPTIPDVPDATPGMIFVPPLSCFFQNDVNAIPSVNEVSPIFDQYVANVFITSRVGNTVTLNGTTLDPATALANPGTTEWETFNISMLTDDIAVVADGPIAIGLVGANNSAGFGGYYSGFAVTPEDTDTDICAAAGPINLLERFDGNPPTGGTWTPPLDSGTDIFDPTTDPISNPSLIYNYVAVGDCDPIDVDITITLVDNPSIDVIDDLTACETFTLADPATLSGNFLNNPQYYTALQSDPTATLIDWTTPITTTTTVFVYDENPADPDMCPDELSFTVTITDEAIANPVPPVRICDDNTNDGTAIFNLEMLTESIILGTQSASNFTVSWHATEQQAIDNIMPFVTPTAYDTTSTTIYARIESNSSAICFDTTAIDLIVDSQPTANAVPTQNICDDSSADGIENFDLTTLNSIILGTQSDTLYNIDFYPTPTDASSETNLITTPTNFTVTGTETITARIDNVSNDNCADFTDITLTIIPQATATDPGSYIVCDDSADGDDTNQFTTFDLSTLDDDILNGQDPTIFTVTYHDNPGDANANNGALPTTFINTDAEVQPITARVSNTQNDACFAIVTFNIVVAPLPVINSPVSLSQCDIDQDGFAFFNLTESQVLLSSDSENETFLYYDLSGAAIANPTAYTNQIQNNESVSVTISTINGCTRQAQIDLEVDTSEIPDTFQLEYFECDTDSDGQSVFDFSDATAQVLALFPAGQMLTVSYYETQQEAETETNPITATIDAYTNNLTYTDTNGQQGIWVRVDGDTANDCRGLGIHVLLNVEANPTFLPNISSLEECSPIANAAQFDLTENDAQITGGDSNILVTYYENVGNYTAMNDIANPTAFSNSSNPQTIYYSLGILASCVLKSNS